MNGYLLYVFNDQWPFCLVATAKLKQEIGKTLAGKEDPVKLVFCFFVVVFFSFVFLLLLLFCFFVVVFFFRKTCFSLNIIF